MRWRSRGLAITLTVACTTAGDSDEQLPYQTTSSTAGDTVVASTTGDVPDRLLRHLVVEWSIKTDTAQEIIGDVNQMAVDTAGRVWVWDSATPALWLVEADGASMRRVARPGSGPGEYRNVNDIAVMRDGGLVMWDQGNSRLTFYVADGQYRSSVPVQFTDCCGLQVIVDTLNRIWLTTHPQTIGRKEKPLDPEALMRNQIGYVRYDSSGTAIDTIMAPTFAGADKSVNAFQMTPTSFGGRMRRVPYGTYPLLAVSPLGHVVSALARPYAVHTEANGKPLRLTREYVPPPVDEAERAQHRASIEFTMRQVKTDFEWNGPEIPHEKPPIDDLDVGLDGRIWVQLSVPSEAYEPDPPSEKAKDRPPPVKFRSGEKRWDVFEPDGRYLGRIVAPREVGIFVMRGNQAWGVSLDENDVPAIVRLRVEPRLP